MDELIKQLKDIKKITPDQSFVERSRRLVLSASQTPQANPHFSTSWRLNGLFIAATAGLAALFIYLAISSSGSAKLVKKEPAPEFDINLSKATYYKEIIPNVYIVVLGNK